MIESMTIEDILYPPSRQLCIKMATPLELRLLIWEPLDGSDGIGKHGNLSKPFCVIVSCDFQGTKALLVISHPTQCDAQTNLRRP